MSGWTAKRFWKAAEVVAAPRGFTVHLDGRPVKTPAKAPLVVPTRTMADAMAAEWGAQTDKIDPRTMPVTRSANAAIDKVRPQHAEVVALMAEYGGTDLLCYRAATPQRLVTRQSEAWDPLLAWAEATFGARLTPTEGIVPIAQPGPALAALAAQVAVMNEFQLTALHDLVAISGSLVLGLAVARGHLCADDAWTLSRIDEDWQIEQWGSDDEAMAEAAIKRAALVHAHRFWSLSTDAG
ncbi:ATP12 family chaperone protein [Phaeovulum sp.]|uniref:ATP12 family chaperone protein n=1 Tax=Phaeovulum sp. TaxID=2934796 RepID=UPI0039E53E46